MSYLLGTALQAYETSAISQVASSSLLTDFNEMIKNDVPEGHTFKGFPIQLNHCAPKRIFSACMRHRSFVEIVECVGDKVRFGLRCKVVVYPEEVMAVWVMIAVKFRYVK
jgi:centrosomal protein CEP76